MRILRIFISGQASYTRQVAGGGQWKIHHIWWIAVNTGNKQPQTGKVNDSYDYNAGTWRVSTTIE